jgi:hypothetical protein
LQQSRRIRAAVQASADQLAEAQAWRDLAEQRRIELDRLDVENAKLFRECEKLKHDIAAVRNVRDGLRAEVYRLRREVARTAQDPFKLPRAELVKWVHAAVHPDRVLDPAAKAYLHTVFTEFTELAERRQDWC